MSLLPSDDSLTTWLLKPSIEVLYEFKQQWPFPHQKGKHNDLIRDWLFKSTFHIRQTLFIRFSWINTYYLHILAISTNITQLIFEHISVISTKTIGSLNKISSHRVGSSTLDSKRGKLEKLVDDL